MELPLVCIDGTRSKYDRHLILIAGKNVKLSAVPFKFITILALVRKAEPIDCGWVRKELLYYSQGHAHRYVYILRKQIKEGLQPCKSLCDWSAVENDRQGCYRLNTRPDRVRILNEQALRDFGDAQVTTMLDMYTQSHRIA